MTLFAGNPQFSQGCGCLQKIQICLSGADFLCINEHRRITVTHSSEIIKYHLHGRKKTLPKDYRTYPRGIMPIPTQVSARIFMILRWSSSAQILFVSNKESCNKYLKINPKFPAHVGYGLWTKEFDHIFWGLLEECISYSNNISAWRSPRDSSSGNQGTVLSLKNPLIATLNSHCLALFWCLFSKLKDGLFMAGHSEHTQGTAGRVYRGRGGKHL